MPKIQQAETKFLDGYTCSQAIFSTYCEQFNIDVRSAFNLSCGFAAGMRMGKTCGAVSGAIMILGLAFSGPHSEQMEDREEVYAAVCEFTEKFIQEYGSTECKDLLTVDISTEKGKQEATERNLFHTLCPNFIKTSAELLESMLKGI